VEAYVRKLALIALCSTALIAIGHSNAHASVVGFTGPNYLWSGSGNLYGTNIAQNNVVNAAGSGLYDDTNPASGTSSQYWHTGFVTTGALTYSITWYYAGSESGDVVEFNSGGDVHAITNYQETNLNNNHSGNSSGFVNLTATLTSQTSGQATHYTYGGIGPGYIPFSLYDMNTLHLANNDGSGTGGSFIFSYVTQRADGSGWDLTATASDWFAFGFNDQGSSDDNHDDYMGVAHLVALTCPTGGCGQSTVPLPAALPLFGSVLGGGVLFDRIRRRRRKARKGAVIA
jgi:hypothetical protein